MLDEKQPAPLRRRQFPASAGPTVSAPAPGKPATPPAEPSPPLMLGRYLTCPGCEQQQDILDFIPFDYSEKYADQVVAVHRCRRCGHVFALADQPGGSDA